MLSRPRALFSADSIFFHNATDLFRTCTVENELLCAQCFAGLHVHDSSQTSVTLRRFAHYGVSVMGGEYDIV